MSNPILTRMLDRLFAAMVNGPSLNCRPHSSRQRVDLAHLDRLDDLPPSRLLLDLLGDDRRVRVAAKVEPPPDLPSPWGRKKNDAPPEEAEADDDNGDTPASPVDNKPKEDPQLRKWQRQKSLMTKLRVLSSDARTYEQDTGVHALNIGYPLLALPPGTMGGQRRIVAPVAFIPVDLTVNTGHRAGLELTCRGEGADLVVPNDALLAWVERQTGKPPVELFADEEGVDPWREIRELVEYVAGLLDLQPTSLCSPITPAACGLAPAPKADDLSEATIIPAAVLGLFPSSKQGLVRDTQAMLEGDATDGPVGAFIDVSVNLDIVDDDPLSDDVEVERSARIFTEERLVAQADPCQSRAVQHARENAGLVIHGPPGTGKSQTITNIIGDHLARGQRVLFVCDKRTALDVVANRLEHLGLGDLCALVHDPQRDQRDLYMAVRAQLDDLADVNPPRNPWPKLERIDEELQRIHAELTDIHTGLMGDDGDGDGLSFHELVGQWLGIHSDESVDLGDDAGIDLFDQHHQAIEVALQRGRKVEYPTNRWARCAGITLEQYLARPIDEVRRSLASCSEDARGADATLHDNIPPFAPDRPLDEQATQRSDLADRLEAAERVTEPVARRCLDWPSESIQRHRQAIHGVADHLETLRQCPLDRELMLAMRDQLPSPATINTHLADLTAYERAATKWYAFLLFGLKGRVKRILLPFGLTLSPGSAKRVQTFLIGLRARIVLSDLYDTLTANPQPGGPAGDELLDQTLTEHRVALDILHMREGAPDLAEAINTVLLDADQRAALIDGLRRSGPRATALATLETNLKQVDLFADDWLAAASAGLRGGRRATENLALLEEQFDTLEDVLRIDDTVTSLPTGMQAALRDRLRAGVLPDSALDTIRKAALYVEIQRRLAERPDLARLDGDHVRNSFDRYRELDLEKQGVVQRAIQHHWLTRQRERLLASTGSRLNSLGADTRRRLFIRGRRAMRLRQVIHVSRDVEHGDPLFDLRPVWMCSPETVAQVFPRTPLFDVVIFDEASQCRLEEALPVLTRAKRVVIAGDPKQLPPTRFFEAAVATSEDDTLETDQDLFEAQQGEVEDLLAAALNLEIQESYLDVHYRSQNADLIAFSNENFYHSRLQALPGHPSHRARFAPLTMHRADGVYEDRANEVEATRVCDLVHDLLRRADPPSIGIACFNLPQRDLITQMLDDRAAEDADFAARLSKARQRRGEGSFEGLFVKNLENVQGDERDHIIISTTYGPAPNGKFYRRFGPLGQAGGGRRLNVLVTRARQEVHLVTSIPRETYHTLSPLPEGTTPGGGWLLLAYLRFAEELADAYEQNHRILNEAQADNDTRVNVLPSDAPSPVAVGLGQSIARAHATSSDIHWGNDGFCIDVALHHPTQAEEVTLGVLCDTCRYPRAFDPVEWDVFRTGLLESMGWQLHRLWSPHLVRDPDGCLNRIRNDAEAMVEQGQERA